MPKKKHTLPVPLPSQSPFKIIIAKILHTSYNDNVAVVE